MHEGHRVRLVSKIKDGGIVYEHELLEILLFNSCPRKDLNAAAHVLLDSFGSIEGVLEADSAELSKVPGIGVNMAEYLTVLGRALQRARGGKDTFTCVSNVSEFRKYINSRPAPESDCLELFCLDKDGGVRRVCTFYAEPTETEMLTLLSVHSPYGLFVAARKTGGAALNAKDDELSVKIDQIARLCGATMYDYCIVGGDGQFYSYKMNDRTVFANVYGK